MATEYLTIEHEATGLYKEKGSRFLSFAEYVETKEAAMERVAFYRKQYHDARHVCFAYIIGSEGEESRSGDDGEPAGTAGKPILTQIKAKNITNTLVVVVRYFGGILLGTGGLVAAYRSATQDALTKAGVTQKWVMVRKKAICSQADYPHLMQKLAKTGCQIISQDWSENECIIEYAIKKADEHRL